MRWIFIRCAHCHVFVSYSIKFQLVPHHQNQRMAVSLVVTWQFSGWMNGFWLRVSIWTCFNFEINKMFSSHSFDWSGNRKRNNCDDVKRPMDERMAIPKCRHKIDRINICPWECTRAILLKTVNYICCCGCRLTLLLCTTFVRKTHKCTFVHSMAFQTLRIALIWITVYSPQRCNYAMSLYQQEIHRSHISFSLFVRIQMEMAWGECREMKKKRKKKKTLINRLTTRRKATDWDGAREKLNRDAVVLFFGASDILIRN